jgi:alpha-tubulin suppressor-like RCC1 family protein
MDSATVRLADGTVASWGANGVGQLGNGTTDQSASPVKVDGLSNVVAVGSGDLNGFAITAS